MRHYYKRQYLEQKNIEKSLKAIHDRKIERERIIELERIEDEKQLIHLNN